MTEADKTPDLGPTQKVRSPCEIAADLNASALEIRNIRSKDARKLYEKVYAMTKDDASCLVEMAASLAGLAYLNNDAGDVTLAVSQNFEVISLLSNIRLTPALVDAYSNLAWVFYSFGNFSNALDYASKALKAAQILQHDFWLARALDVYGFTFFADAADLDETLASQEQAAQLLGKIGNYSEQARVYNNIADSQLHGGRLEAALEFSRKSVALTREADSPLVETIAVITLAEVLVAMEEYEQAQTHLQEAMAKLSEETPVIFKTYILASLAQTYLASSQVDLAEASLLEALKIADSVNSVVDQVVACQILAEVYERKHEHAKALEYYKKFSLLNEKLLTEKAARQLYALKVAANLETAQRDAEIHRLKNIELQSEIRERNRIQKELETLAITDHLTGLYNRRHFFQMVEREIEQMRRFHRSITLVMVDLDDFKRVNDKYGHPTGDSVLHSVGLMFRDSTRSVDIVCRYGGEEFAILMPETDSAMGGLVVERIRKKLHKRGIKTEQGIISITFSAGVAGFHTSATTSPMDMETLIKWADHALYRAKDAGKNRTVVHSGE